MPARTNAVNGFQGPATAAAAAVLVGALLGWAYAPVLASMARKWSSDPQYSHGYLVPLFAAALLWVRRPLLAGIDWRINWLGVPLLALAGALRIGGAMVNFVWLESASLVLALAGLAVLAGGWAALRWSWPAVAFLMFMVPLPYTVEKLFAWPLQRTATLASNYALQTIGLPASAEGTVIVLEHVRLGVEEACSGLSMLMIFLALSTAVAVVIRRPLWERLAVLASAVPIAVLANVTRITVTGLMYEWANPKWAELVFHDLAGWLMMPFALAVLGAELWLFARLFPEEAEEAPMPLLGTGGRGLGLAGR
jgi:exosortase